MIVLNVDGEYIYEIKNLDHVYNGCLSVDGSILWLVSNSNVIYSISTNDFSVSKITIKENKMRFNGKCQSSSLDNSVYVSVVDGREGVISHLRKYNESGHYTSIISEDDRFYIQGLEYVESVDKYLLIVCIRNEEPYDQQAILWYDEKNESKTIIPTQAFNTDMPLNIEINSDKRYILYGNKMACDFDGKLISPPNDRMFDNLLKYDKDKFKKIVDFIKKIPLIDEYEIPTFICCSCDLNYLYIATNRRFTVVDSNTLEIIDKINMGFIWVEALKNGNILISDGCDTRLYRLIK